MDPDRYGALLAEVRPGLIETAEEHERLLTIAEQLMEKEAGLSEEEEKLLALLVLLIEAFESGAEEDDGEEAEPAEPPKPHETLQRLAGARGMEARELSDFFGNPHAASEAFTGRRPISRGQAKELGRFFGVPPRLFHS